jgi:peptidoglycan hydrolase-like protein with peptidoglycan-binding domain
VSRTKLIAWGGGVLTLAVAVLAVVGFGGADGTPPATGATGTATTAKIMKRTLTDTRTIAGELDYGDAVPLVSKAAGTLTWLPAVGTTIQRGGVLLRADNLPVTLLYGALPAYRELTVGVEGPDVTQFEQNLGALGYSGFTVDEKYNASTASAVKRWQKDLGLPETGKVDPTAVIYAAGKLRIEEQTVRVGAPATGEVLACTGTRKVVTLNLSANDHAWATPGVSVTITLPGGVTVAGKIATVGNEAASGGADRNGDPQNSDSPGTGNATVAVTIAIADQRKLGTLTKTPVDAHYLVGQRKDVLTVPVAALLALAQGGYGLELVTPSGSQVVAVDVGLFADGQVEVRGAGITEGQTVGMPS